MAELTPSQVANIAHLARLSLTADELRTYGASLSQIITLVAELERADTAGVEPMSHSLPGMQARLRADQVTESDQRQLLQQNAPQVEAGLYLVPKVIE